MNVPAKTNQNKAVGAPLSVQQLMAADRQEGRTGGSGLSAADLAIPFLILLQAKSPIVAKGPEHKEGAEEGFFYNNVSGKIYKGPLFVVPCGYRKAFVEWMPRGSSGNYVREHSDGSALASCIRNEKNKYVLPNQNLLVETQYHYVLLVDEKTGMGERMVISLSSTQLKKGLRWNSQVTSILVKMQDGKLWNPPRYTHTYKVSSVYESKNENSWMGWEVGSPNMITDPELYAMARRFANEVESGSVKMSQPPSNEQSHEQPEREVF
jgi:hypothetical protein